MIKTGVIDSLWYLAVTKCRELNLLVLTQAKKVRMMPRQVSFRSPEKKYNHREYVHRFLFYFMT